MKIFYSTLLIGLLFLITSCGDTKKAAVDKVIEQPDSVAEQQNQTFDNEISLEPVVSNVPQFSDAKANAFVKKMKNYYEEMVKAVKEKNTEKELELQQQSIDMDSEYLKIKDELNEADQKKLADWYMKLVETAAY